MPLFDKIRERQRVISKTYKWCEGLLLFIWHRHKMSHLYQRLYMGKENGFRSLRQNQAVKTCYLPRCYFTNCRHSTQFEWHALDSYLAQIFWPECINKNDVFHWSKQYNLKIISEASPYNFFLFDSQLRQFLPTLKKKVTNQWSLFIFLVWDEYLSG